MLLDLPWLVALWRDVAARERHREGAADAGLAFHANLTAQQAHKVMGDRQAEPSSAELARAAVVDLAELLEDMLDGLLRDADAREWENRIYPKTGRDRNSKI